MSKIKLFISSVQSEFEAERKALANFLRADALLSKFFEPFLFEELPAIDKSVQQVYLNEVESSQIYLGIIGRSMAIEIQKVFLQPNVNTMKLQDLVRRA